MMEHLLIALQEDRVEKLVLAPFVVAGSTARHMGHLITQCCNLIEIDVSLHHITLDALRYVLYGASQCPSCVRIVINGGFTIIQAKVLSNCVRYFGFDAPSTSPHGFHYNNSPIRRFPINSAAQGVTLILAPTMFDEVSAAVLNNQLEQPSRIVDILIRSTVSTAQVLFVVPKFRRRVQGILKRNRRLLSSTTTTKGTIADLQPRRLFTPTYAAATAHMIPEMHHPELHQQAACPPTSSPREPSLPTWDSATPSPEILPAPECVQFREPDTSRRAITGTVQNVVVGKSPHDDVLHPMTTPNQHSPTPPSAPPATGSESAFQRHVILQMAVLHDLISRNVQGTADLSHQIAEMRNDSKAQRADLQRCTDEIMRVANHIHRSPPPVAVPPRPTVPPLHMSPPQRPPRAAPVARQWGQAQPRSSPCAPPKRSAQQAQRPTPYMFRQM